MHKPWLLGIWCLTANVLWGQGPGPGGGPGDGGGSTPQISFHIPNEMAPPGGLAQMKFMVTVPTPISSGGPSFSVARLFDGVWGIELFCPDGDLNGVATINGSHVEIRYTTTAGAQGTDYPIMTMALHLRPDAGCAT